ncbi:MAG: hypothetical protein LUG93_12540 [Lachnospiraceae bacterium]|nr:hypothetical protein [Lachnospiraceae bacterium]MCD7956544.1 hypothetical protein [Lachnospiraceae bacterium]
MKRKIPWKLPFKLPKNLPLKMLSVVVAFLIWLVVANVSNPTTSKLFRDIKIEIINEDSVTEIDKAFDIVSEDSVVIKVTERKRVLESLSASDFTVVADMENLTEMNTVPLTVTCSNSAVTLDEITVVPSSMKVELEQIVESEFVVTVETTGTPVNGYEVGTTEVQEGKTVQIAGPESLIEKIGQVTASVSVNGISTDQRLTSVLSISDKNGDTLSETQMSRLQIKDSSGVLLSDNSVTVNVELWEVLYEVPIEIQTYGTPESGYEVTGVSTVPTTINLVGTDEALEEIDTIVVSEQVSVSGATETFTQEVDLSTTISEMENVRLASGVDSSVTVTIQVEKNGDQTVSLALSELTVLNRPDNLVLTFSPADAISVTVHAEDEESTISGSEIFATIDLSVCTEAGDYEIPVEIELPEGYTLVSEVTITVNATEAEQQAEASTED